MRGRFHSVPPGRVRSKLLELLGDSLVSEVESGGDIVRWEPEGHRSIRADAPDLIDALDGRSLEPVLQLAGVATLHELGTVHSLRLVALARRCVAGLRKRLQEALNGRGAFRRFKDAIHDVDGDTLSAWTIFSEERSLGRARQRLADHGYRPKA